MTEEKRDEREEDELLRSTCTATFRFTRFTDKKNAPVVSQRNSKIPPTSHSHPPLSHHPPPLRTGPSNKTTGLRGGRTTFRVFTPLWGLCRVPRDGVLMEFYGDAREREGGRERGER